MKTQTPSRPFASPFVPTHKIVFRHFAHHSDREYDEDRVIEIPVFVEDRFGRGELVCLDRIEFGSNADRPHWTYNAQEGMLYENGGRRKEAKLIRLDQDPAYTESEIRAGLNHIILKAEALLAGKVPGSRYGTLRLIKSNLEAVIALVGDDRP